MNKKIICLLIVVGLFLGCSMDMIQGEQPPPLNRYAKYKADAGGGDGLVFNPDDVEGALPEMRDLPVPAAMQYRKPARQYTGIIKNKTNYEVSVPSGNSGASLVIPANGWIEYTSWARRFDLTAYYDGRPFYCLKINANIKNYAFMCQKYDFIAEIVKAEPKAKPTPKRKVIKKKKETKDEGVKGFG